MATDGPLASTPVIIAHRGATRLAPENTLAAVSQAIALGVDMVEIDLQATADNQLVVIHDDELSRTTDGSGPVAGATLAEIKRLDAGGWFGPEFAGERVPTLAEVCALAAGKVALNVEIKCCGAEFAGLMASFLACLREYDLLNSTVVSSFDLEVLAAIRGASPEVRTAYLYLVQWFDAGAPELDYLALSAFHPEHHLLSRAQIEEAHERGLVVNAWTVDEVETALRLREWGVDGIITNIPEQLRAALDGADPNQVASPGE